MHGCRQRNALLIWVPYVKHACLREQSGTPWATNMSSSMITICPGAGCKEGIAEGQGAFEERDSSSRGGLAEEGQVRRCHPWAVMDLLV